MKLCSQSGYLAITNDCSCEVTDHGGTHVTGCLCHHHFACWARCFASLHLWDSLLNHINGDWDGRAFHWWLITQVVWVPVKLRWEAFGSALARPSALSLHSLTSLLHHSSQVCHQNISVLSSKLISKAVDFWKLGVDILVDLVDFLASMVHCMSGISSGCIVWCPSALPAYQALKAFRLAAMDFSTCSFHYQVSRCQRCGRVAPHTSCLEQYSLDVPDILSGPISYTYWYAHMQVEDREMIACLRFFKLPNFEARGELKRGFWWHINPHVAYKKLMLWSYCLARDHLHLWQVCAWSYIKRWSHLCGYISPLVRVEMAVTFLQTYVPKKQAKC